MNEILQTALAVLGTIGGFEFIKWIFTRKSNSRIVAAEADAAETKSDTDDFHLLRERLEFADKQLLDNQTRYNEQTALVRDLNRQLLEKTLEVGNLKSRISELEAERKMKLCERRGCAQRQPQSGY